MSKPENPDTVIIKNSYYPKGLTEKDIWEYYNNNRKKIIKEVNNNPVLLFLVTDDQYDPIVKRKWSGSDIKLTEKTFDQYITGRTLSISMEQGERLQYYILDIDSTTSNVLENELKECVRDVIRFYKNMEEIKSIRVTNSSSGYHVYGYLKNPVTSKQAIQRLEYVFSSLNNKYDVNIRKNNKKQINIDFSPLYKRGSITVPYSLTRNGLICKDITNILDNYKREDSIIPGV